MSKSPLVVDLSHHNKVESFDRVYAAGIRGVIHKATEGLAFVDRTYLTRRELVRGTGLLWGAYHFGNASDPVKQAEHFLATVGKPAGGWDGILLALDWEPNPNAGGEMTLEQAKTFMRVVAERTGQKPVIYSGHLLKEKLGRLADPFLSEHRLWMPQYGPRAVLPPGWERYFLWQYTGDGIGNGPHEIDGISSKGIDLNVYDGTAEELAAEWVVPVAPAPAIASTGRTVLAEAEPTESDGNYAEVMQPVAEPAETVAQSKPIAKTVQSSRTVFGTLLAAIGVVLVEAKEVIAEAANQIVSLAPAREILGNLGLSATRIATVITVAGLGYALYARLHDAKTGANVKGS